MNAMAERPANVDQDFINSRAQQACRASGWIAGHPAGGAEQASAEVSAAVETLELHRVEGRTFRLSRIFSVVTFFALFNLKPQGRNTVCVCRGTACHTRGSADLLEKADDKPRAAQTGEDGETDQMSLTTPDGDTTLRTVACFGQCALAPVVEVNHSIFGHMNERMLMREMEALDKREPRP